jgi:glycosidase
LKTIRRAHRPVSLAILMLTLSALFILSCQRPVPPDQREGWIPREKREALMAIDIPSRGEVKDYLHVPSPDWRDQVVYFIMPDRFDDGDPSNSDQGAGEYDPSKNSHYSGGDLRGIIDNLDYIKGLGATAVWITPPVANQWYDYSVNYGGYHGYWGEHFIEVDAHMGSLRDYQLLSAALHRNGMYLIQDIVPNHTGNYFTYTGPASQARPERNYLANEQYVPERAPRQYPFNLNDPRDEKAVEAAAYHWTGPIRNYNVENEVHNYQLSDLDDINTENPMVRDVLRESYGYWISEVGVDGFRIDTVKYIPKEFFIDFHYSDDPDAPGVMNVARELGKENFTSFGEAWIGATPYDDAVDRDIASYLGSPSAPALQSMLNFSLNQEMRAVFGSGAPTEMLNFRMASLAEHFPDPNLLYTFIDNHDMDRFLSISGYREMELALLYLFTAPGIPVVYYGTEQQFSETRQAMFANGFASGGEDHFDPANEAYRYISSLAELRAGTDAFRYGEYRALAGSANGPGILAYSMSHGGESFYILMNTAPFDYLAADLDSGLEGAFDFETLFAVNASGVSLQSDRRGLISAVLPGRSALVLVATEAIAADATGIGTVMVDGYDGSAVATSDFALRGRAAGLEQVELVIDGNVGKTYPADVDGSGGWSLTVPAERLANGSHRMAVIARENGRIVASSGSLPLEIDLAFSQAAAISDPVGDDRGPEGTYSYPNDVSFDGQMDIEGVRVFRAGTNLRIELKMASPISTVWQPQNGFDHVVFYVYIDDPAKPGATALPFQNSSAPVGYDWDTMLMAGGWNASVFAADGASADSYGEPVSSSLAISIDEAQRTITLGVESSALGYPEDLSGFGLYITTWDYDGLESANRMLQAEADDYILGGGDYLSDPLIMDDTEIIRIP